MKRIAKALKPAHTREDGHVYVWTGGGLLTVLLIILLILIIF